MEQERDRLVAARQRLVTDRRRRGDDLRVAKGEYVAAVDLNHYQRLERELERVQAKLDLDAAATRAS
jgi:hypothetical protein